MVRAKVVLLVLLFSCAPLQRPAGSKQQPQVTDPGATAAEAANKNALTLEDLRRARTYFPLRVGEARRFSWSATNAATDVVLAVEKRFGGSDKIDRVLVRRRAVLDELSVTNDLVFYYLADMVVEGKVIFIKEPIQAGTSWDSNESQFAISETDVSVRTKAGHFNNCIKVSQSLFAGAILYWYCPGVGRVMSASVEKPGSSERKGGELVSYEPP